MIWTVLVTWGCQLGGGNEKECMSTVPPSLGAAPARRGAPAASMPAAVPASTSRRVNGTPPTGTTVPAPETNKAMILLLAALYWSLAESVDRICGIVSIIFRRAPESPDGAFGRQMAAITPPLA